jgi:hypothetical protein
MAKKKTSDNVKQYGMPVRIKLKTVLLVNKLSTKPNIPFNTKLWNICKRLAEKEGIEIE